MKSKEYYINRYREQKRDLEQRNELWRLCQETEEIFIKKLDEIFDRFSTNSFLNEFHKESSTKASLEILLQKRLSLDEMKEQTRKIKIASEESFRKEAPKIKKYVSNMSVPLTISDLSHIYIWLFRKQITLDDLPLKVKKEFTHSKQYTNLIRRLK